MHLIKPIHKSSLNLVLNKDYSPEELYYADLNDNDKDIDIYDIEGNYLDSISKEDTEGASIEDLVEQNEFGIGRPKLKEYKLKRNRLKFTLYSVEDRKWYFLPFITAGEMKEFLINIDVKGNITDLISKLVRGEVLSFIVPENRDPYIKNILKYGAQANPYKLGKDASNVGMLRKK